LSLCFADKEEVLTLSPQQLFLMMHDKEGKIACLTMMLGHRTINSTFQLVGTRFIYDVKESKFNSLLQNCAPRTPPKWINKLFVSILFVILFG
jgi:hypothetical protein